MFHCLKNTLPLPNLHHSGILKLVRHSALTIASQNCVYKNISFYNHRKCLSKQSRVQIITEGNVHKFINSLQPQERKLLLENLISNTEQTIPDIDKGKTTQYENILNQLLLATKEKQTPQHQAPNPTNNKKGDPLWKQLMQIFIYSGLPYFIFGFMDNTLMILAGEAFDNLLKPMGYSTLTCIAFGNAIADIISTVFTVYIEKAIVYFLIFTKIKLPEAELRSPLVTRVGELSKPICIGLGALLGMWPLCFINP